MLLAAIFSVLIVTATCHFGLVDPVFTAFDASQDVNFDAISAYAKWTHDQGTDTVILGGSTGEWPSLSAEERIHILQAWRAALDKLPHRSAPLRPRPRLIFHAGDVSVRQAQALARQSAAAGADAVLIVAPCIMKPSSTEMLTKVIGLIANETSLPAFYYHYPALYNVDFPPNAMSAFLHEVMRSGSIPTLAGIKYIDDTSSDDFKTILGLGGGRFEILAAMTSNVKGAVELGVGGMIGYTPYGSYVNAIAQAWRANDTVKVDQNQQRLSQLVASLKNASSTKMAARYSSRLLADGLDLGAPRLPLSGLTTVEFDRMQKALQHNGFIPGPPKA